MDEQNNMPITECEKKYVSDVIEWERDIAPYRIIEIIAGVGSGKNHWIENELMTKPQGNEEENKRVLLITSRKAKVKETANRTGLAETINLYRLEPKKISEYWGDIQTRQGCCVCNNWHIEYYVKNIFRHDDESTHLWKYFDVIVVDEAHSLATDATFCDAPFHLLSFLKMVYMKSEAKILLMTATPDSIKELIKLREKHLYKILDLRTTCRNVTPKEVTYVTQRWAIETIIKKYREDPDGKWHIVYFATRTTTIGKKLLKELTEAGIPEEKIAVSFSRFDEDGIFSEKILSNKKRTEESLAEHEKLPEDIRIFLSTSRNKEGINIRNPHCQWIVMIESQWADEIEQMCGRVRTMNENNLYYLIHDAPQHEYVDYAESFDYLYEKWHAADLGETFDTWCNIQKINAPHRYESRRAREQIEKLEEQKLTYLRYNVFSEKFEKYIGRIFGQNNYYNRRLAYFTFVDAHIGHRYYIDPVCPPIALPYHFLEEHDSYKYVNDYIHEKHYLDEGVYLSPEEVSGFLDYLSLKGIKNSKGQKYLNLGNVLSKFGYQVVDKFHKTNHPFYGYKQIVISKKPEISVPAGEDCDSVI